MRKISLKHIEVRSCFDDFIEGNSVMQLDFSSDARLKNYSIFKPQINLHALTSSFFSYSAKRRQVAVILPKRDKPDTRLL